jgi:hypothetical protein
MNNEEKRFTALGAEGSDGGAVVLTDFELGLVLGGNESDVTGSSTMEHLGHVSTFATIGGALGGQAGALVGVAVGVAYEVVEHGGDDLARAAQEYQNNPPPI